MHSTNVKAIFLIFFRIGIFMCLFASSNFIQELHARQVSFYNDCISGKSENTSNGMSMINNVDTFFIGGVNSDCYLACDKKCKEAFGRKDKSAPELNKDVIYKCISRCQRGQQFTSKYAIKRKEEGQSIKFLYSNDKEIRTVGVQAACAVANPTIHKSNFLIDASDFQKASGDVILKISLIGSTENKIYLKGKKLIKMYPAVFMIKDDQYFDKNGVNDSIITREIMQIMALGLPTLQRKLLKDEKNFEHPCMASSREPYIRYMTDSNTLYCSSSNTPPTMCPLYDERCPEINKRCDMEAVAGCQDNKECIAEMAQEDMCFWNWNIRNRNYTNTGITVQDGDELSITWSGDIIRRLTLIPFLTSDGSMKMTNININYKKAKIAYFDQMDPMLALLPAVFRQNKDNMTIITALLKDLIPQSPMEVLREYSTIEVKNLAPLIGEEARKAESNEKNAVKVCGPNDSTKSLPAFQDPKWYGLNGMVMDGSTTYDNSDSKSITEKNITSCDRVADTSLPKYSFNGTINGIPHPTLLELRHYNRQGNSTYLGGFNVEIEWGGRPIKNGEYLQYAIVESYSQGNTMPVEIEWRTLDLGLNKSIVKIPLNKVITKKYGKYSLFFRINPRAISNNSENITRIENAIGAYNVRVSYPSIQEGVGSFMINQIMKTFLNSDDIINKPIGKNSLMETIYNNMILYIKPIVIALATLYVALMGFSITSGLTEISLNDFIKQIIRLAILIASVSKQSWTLVSEYLIPLCISSGLKIANALSPFIDPNTGEVSNSPYAINILELLGGFLRNLGDGEIWSKIGAIAISNVLGFGLSLIIICSLLFCTLVMVKVIMVYIISIAGIIFLILCTPVFLSFTLFQSTRQYFEYWYKSLISFTLYPVFTLSASSFFYIVITFLMNATMNFTACKTCFLYIPFVDHCLIKAYGILLNSHIPSAGGLISFFTPMGIAEASIALMLTSYSFYKMIGFLIDMINRMTGQISNAKGGADPGKVTDSMSDAAIKKGLLPTLQLLRQKLSRSNKSKNDKEGQEKKARDK